MWIGQLPGKMLLPVARQYTQGSTVYCYVILTYYSVPRIPEEVSKAPVKPYLPTVLEGGDVPENKRPLTLLAFSQTDIEVKTGKPLTFVTILGTTLQSD